MQEEGEEKGKEEGKDEGKEEGRWTRRLQLLSPPSLGQGVAKEAKMRKSTKAKEKEKKTTLDKTQITILTTMVLLRLASALVGTSDWR